MRGFRGSHSLLPSGQGRFLVLKILLSKINDCDDHFPFSLAVKMHSCTVSTAHSLAASTQPGDNVVASLHVLLCNYNNIIIDW